MINTGTNRQYNRKNTLKYGAGPISCNLFLEWKIKRIINHDCHLSNKINIQKFCREASNCNAMVKVRNIRFLSPLVYVEKGIIVTFIIQKLKSKHISLKKYTNWAMLICVTHTSEFLCETRKWDPLFNNCLNMYVITAAVISILPYPIWNQFEWEFVNKISLKLIKNALSAIVSVWPTTCNLSNTFFFSSRLNSD